MCGGGGGIHAATEINLRLPALQFMAASNARETHKTMFNIGGFNNPM